MPGSLLSIMMTLSFQLYQPYYVDTDFTIVDEELGPKKVIHTR